MLRCQTPRRNCYLPRMAGSPMQGCLLGLMVGDALGLPREGLSPGRARRLFGDQIRHAFLAGRGMISDDTEHACFTGQALLAAPRDPDAFARCLAWKLRLWLLGLPAGVGWATLRSILKLWIGFPPDSSGVESAGNGPAMRAPVIGAFFARDPERLAAFTLASTRMTHRDPRADRGALAVARAAAYAVTHPAGAFSTEELLSELDALFPPEDEQAREWLGNLRLSLRHRREPERAAKDLGLENGVSGYIYRTVPAALWAWLHDPADFRGGLGRIIRLGGDADTAGAICGALLGITAGAGAIPQEWLDGVMEFPRTPSWIRELGARLDSASRGAAIAPLPLAWPWLLIRNPLFLTVVLIHGFRRLFPPY